MQPSQRIDPNARKPTQREPAAHTPSGSQRRGGHGLGDNGRPGQVGGLNRQVGRHPLSLHAADRARHADGVAHEPCGLGQRGAGPDRLTRHPRTLPGQVSGENVDPLARDRRDRHDRRPGQAARIEETAQVSLDGRALILPERVDVGEHDRHGRVRGAQAREPFVVQARIRILLRIDHDDQGVHARSQAPGDLAVRDLNRIDVGQVDDGRLTSQVPRRVHATADAQPAEQFLGRAAAGQNRAWLVGRGPQDSRAHDLSPGQGIDQRRLARAGAAEHADHAPRRIDLGAIRGHVDELPDALHSLGGDVGGGGSGDLVQICGR